MERRVLVTGAGSGFGLATAVHLSEIGFAVTGLVPDDAEKSALGRATGEAGVEVRAVVADLSDPEARVGLLSGMDLWALVNNAGYMNAGQVRDIDIDEARHQLETMVLAPLDLARQALPAMTSRRDGRIVNVTSAAVHTSTPLTGWYQACKAALRELNDSLRVEVEPAGVEVIDVEPGGYRTGIWSRAASELATRRERSGQPGRYDRVLRHIGPAKRLMAEPEQVARCIAWVLTAGRPPRHVRIGPGSGLLRVLNDTVPDRLWDRMIRSAAGPE